MDKIECFAMRVDKNHNPRKGTETLEHNVLTQRIVVH